MSIYKEWRTRQIFRELDTPSPRAAAPLAHKVVNYVRRAEPATTLLPKTMKWLARLPVQARPRVLPLKFARIANHLALVWNTPVECRAYFDDLLTDRRGGREGFPLDVLNELQVLSMYHGLSYPVVESAWDVTERKYQK